MYNLLVFFRDKVGSFIVVMSLILILTYRLSPLICKTLIYKR